MSEKEIKCINERYRLAHLEREDLVRIGLVAIIVGFAYMLFHMQGNTTDIRMFGRSAIRWIITRWNQGDGNFSHGWLVPIVSLWLVWRRRDAIADAPKKVSKLGLWVVAAALFMHYIGAKAQQVRLSLIGLVVLTWGVPFYLFGWQVAKQLIFPCTYLIFCIPLNFLDSITFPLRMLVTVIATVLLNGLGIPVERVGSGIHSLTGGFDFDVAAPCSGLRSLLAMTALTAVYANLTQKTLIKQWILFLCAIPLAVIGNLVRITSIGLVAQAFGEDLAVNLYHDYSGYVVFAVGILLMVGIGGVLNLNLSEVLKKWKQEYLNPTSS